MKGLTVADESPSNFETTCLTLEGANGSSGFGSSNLKISLRSSLSLSG